MLCALWGERRNTLHSFICCVTLDKYIPISGLQVPICEMKYLV